MRRLVFVLPILWPAMSWASTLALNVAMDTTPLVGHAAGPFSLEFQLNDGSGSGDGNNTVSLTNFTFGGGAATGFPNLIGGATGNTVGGVGFSDNSFFNQFVQTFTPGTQLAFRLNFSTNLDNGGVPDQFTFAILDSLGAELPTQSPFDVFVEIDIDSATPSVQTFATDIARMPSAGGPSIAIAGPVVTEINAVPEPNASILVGILLVLGAVGSLKKTT